MLGEHNEVIYHIPIQLTGLSHEGIRIGGGSNDNKGLLVCDMGCLFPFPTPNSLFWVFNAPSLQAWICSIRCKDCDGSEGIELQQPPQAHSREGGQNIINLG
ncbi:unnamed protein product [Musa acuminata subsp. malaccensis]|uniref:(wild Malaysian banana) hypothetical protein n=1 Tax=Musa acuminata subsp. malaccensis TaxID=214687 RepID=A0A804K4I7_MUSAM|nr:unnamed protein product [Musa acuminata subsp. malaccensis]